MITEVRAARPEDTEEISRLNQLVQSKHAEALPWFFKPEGLSASAIARLLEKPNHVILVAQTAEQTSGYLFAEFRNRPETSLTFAFNSVHIHHICVAESFRRKGIGRELMNAVKGLAETTGLCRITADYWSFNDEAAQFFGSHQLEPYNIRAWR